MRSLEPKDSELRQTAILSFAGANQVARTNAAPPPLSPFHRTLDHWILSFAKLRSTPEPVTFYTLNDIAAGYPDKGIGEGYTLKVGADKKHVVFRRESSLYYLNKSWESDAERSSETGFLLSLNKKVANQTVQ